MSQNNVDVDSWIENGSVKRFHYRTAVFQSFHTCLEALLKDKSYF